MTRAKGESFEDVKFITFTALISLPTQKIGRGVQPDLDRFFFFGKNYFDG